MGVYWKIWFLGKRFTKNQYIGRNCLKKGLGQFVGLKWGLGKREGWHFWGGLDTPMDTMALLPIITAYKEDKEVNAFHSTNMFL